ncbi:MAG: hypothetical protein GF344_14080 [Chitinivibrionales bacterium]|nr:hypothetical protein [Chitinivibrionales bacterium]MBD3357854.1 hypothetical protein [Chitinivibrionales bacterium]
MNDPRLLWGAGVAIAAGFSGWRARQEGLNAGVMLALSVAGIAAAHWLPDVAGQGSTLSAARMLFRANVTEANGRGVFMAYMGASFVGMVTLRFFRLPALKYADASVAGIAAGYCLARVGCFMNGCDFGIPCDQVWATTFAEGTQAYDAHWCRGWIEVDASESLSVHPTQLYHALAGAGGFVLLSTLRLPWAGGRLALGLGYYGLTRFVIEFFRDDYWKNGSMLDIAQWWCVAFVVTALGLRFLCRVSHIQTKEANSVAL